ncbi:translocation/assembly module TamB domain-containing protein [Sphingobacterium deserti]|nr:translocation/assembly module TamB domain-containing protein [Sphingobacterium deserti]
MVYAKSITATLSLARLFENEFEIRKLTLESAYFHYEIYKDSTNVSFLLDYFAPKNKGPKKDKSKLSVNLKQVKLHDSQFKLVDHRWTKKHKGVNFNDLDIQGISGLFDAIRFEDQDLYANIEQLTFREKSGLHVRELSAESYISASKMTFKEFTLRTNRSKLGNNLVFEYDNFANFENFIDSVRVTATLNDAFLDSRDIAFFAPEMSHVRFITTIEQANLSGTVANIKAQAVKVKTGTHTAFQGNLRIVGLPYIDKTKFTFDIDRLVTSAQDLERLIPDFADMRGFKLPAQLHKLGSISYVGNLEGFYHHFSIDGQADSKLGSLKTNATVAIQPTLQYQGQISSSTFNVGEFLNTKSLATTGFDIEFDGMGSDALSLQIAAQGKFHDLYLKDYKYEQILFEGEIENQRVTANGSVQDEQARLEFNGEIGWAAETPVYTFSSSIDLLNLKALQLFAKDSIIVKRSNVSATLSGNSLNSLNGHIYSDHIQFQSSRGDFVMDYLDFNSEGDEQSKLLTLKSDVVDGILGGQIDLNTIVPYFRSLAMRYAPAINIDAAPYNAQNFDLQVTIKSFDAVSALFDPNLRLEDGANLKATFSSDDFTANFKAFSPVVSYKGMKITNLALTEQADDKAFSLSVYADRLNLSDSAYIEHINIQNTLANDSLHFKVMLAENNRANYLNLNGNIHFAHNKPAYIKFDKSEIILNSEPWQINDNADLRVSKGKFFLNDLLITREKQQVSLNGVLSDDETDDLEIAFKDFSLSSLAGITKPMGIQLQGNLSGDVHVHSVFNKPTLSTDIHTTPIIFNNLPIGNLNIRADFDPESGLMRLNSKLLDIDGRGVDLAGTYDVKSSENALQLRGKVNDIDLGILQPFLKNLVSNLYGKMSGDLTIGGTLSQPTINGVSTIREASFLVDYLQTRYHLANQNCLIQDNRLLLNAFRFADVNGSIASAKGQIDLNNLSNPTLDIDALATNFQILNTGRKDNEMFFGTAYASGSFSFKGPVNAVNIDINATSNPNTVITIPFNSSLKVSDNDFFYFTTPDSASAERPLSRRLFEGITMNMDLNLTRDAEINLENNIGSLKGVGTGSISLRIASLGDFEMFGDYLILSGKFHFTAQDFFNKFFDLKEGGTIRWAGNPGEATVNLSATYQQRTSVAPLYNAAGRTENNDRILAQADMILKGTLSQPEISFDLNFPQDPYVKDELQGYLSDGNNINQQAISLIVRRSFTPASTQEFGREVNNTLLSAGTEIAFNQLNSIISQSLNMNFLDLNIRSFNDASASLRFFDDRLILTGGVSDRSRSQLNDLTVFSDQIATDAEITFRLRQDGNLVLRAYNRLNTRNFLFTPYSDYISAVGVVYRQEFNTLSEFWKKLWIWNERKQRLDQYTVPDSVSSN